MKRLLQLGTLLLLLVTFMTPLSEFFDRWDPPGISNDIEFAIFVFVLALCLVLLVSRMIAVLALLVRLAAQPHRSLAENAAISHGVSPLAFFVPPLSPPPLRI